MSATPSLAHTSARWWERYLAPLSTYIIYDTHGRLADGLHG